MSLQEVENAIRVMNQAAFQELGDLFMISRNRDYSAFVCIGSQYGKQKTTKGTPDTFILTHDGKYIMVEYSTNETQKEKKLIECDIWDRYVATYAFLRSDYFNELRKLRKNVLTFILDP